MRKTPSIFGLLIALCAAGAWPASASADGTTGALASLPGKQVFPADDAWNTDVSKEPVDPASDVLIASIGADRPLHPDFGANYNGGPFGIPYYVVSGTQAKVPVKFDYADESDRGPYPIPPDAPIEGGPQSQGDRHVIVVDRDNWLLYELYAAVEDPSGTSWHAGSGAVYDLKRHSMQRRHGWTSADAAGLPIFAGLIRYDEVIEQGKITHALRFTVQHVRRAFIAPASHYVGSSTSESLPPLGMRVRLKADFDVSAYPPSARVILQAMKTYGMILADIGSNWYVSGTPDARWNDDEIDSLKAVRGSDFEVVRMGRIVTRVRE